MGTPMVAPKLQYNFNLIRHYNSPWRGERVNMGIQVKDINTGRCLQKVRTDPECMIGIAPDMTPEQAWAIMPFFGGDRGWQEDPGGFARWENARNGHGGAMACNQIDKGGGGIGMVMQDGTDLTTLEAVLDDLMLRYCAPYVYNKKEKADAAET